MADSSVSITAGTGTPLDTRTQADGDHRQVFTLGDATNTYTQAVRVQGEAAVGYGHTLVTGTISAADAASASTSWVSFSNVTVFTGTPTANSAVVMNVEGQSTFVVQATGTFDMNLSFERTIDGVNWI